MATVSDDRQRQVVEHLQDWNAGRDPIRLDMKYQAMAASLAAFVRGTCSLFYLRARTRALPHSPVLSICGDVHVGNFGVYRSDDGRLRFDLNDFDEAAAAPVLHDVVRLQVAFLTMTADAEAGAAMAALAIEAYIKTLRSDQHAALNADAPEPPIPGLFLRATRRDEKRDGWLDERTVRAPHGERRFRLDRIKTLPCSAGERRALFRAAIDLGRSFGAERIFEPIDAARRISGLGSLGLPRFLLMLRGDAAGVRLLDVKAGRPSALASGLGLEQATGSQSDQAARIVEVQSTILERPSSPLAAISLLGDRFIVRELQSAAVRLDPSFTYPARLGHVLGEALARAHRRTAQREGAAARLDAFACDAPDWFPRVAAAATDLSRLCREDWHAYRDAYHSGAFASHRD